MSSSTETTREETLMQTTPTAQETALKVARAFLMYLADCEETDTDPVIYGEDGFAEYLVEAIPSNGIDLTQALHNEARDIVETFAGATTSAAFDAGYQYAYEELGGDEAGDCCGHLAHQHNEDGGCTACECRAWEA